MDCLQSVRPHLDHEKWPARFVAHGRLMEELEERSMTFETRKIREAVPIRPRMAPREDDVASAEAQEEIDAVLVRSTLEPGARHLYRERLG